MTTFTHYHPNSPGMVFEIKRAGDGWKWWLVSLRARRKNLWESVAQSEELPSIRACQDSIDEFIANDVLIVRTSKQGKVQNDRVSEA